MLVNKGLYRHFKGNYYLVVDVAKDSETQQDMVVYRALYGDKKLWIRPYEMFNEVIEREGVKHKRFAYCDEQRLVLEAAVFDIVEGQATQFELAFEQAQCIISAMTGYISHDIQRCIEQPNQYLLLVQWQTLEDHTVGFKESQQYQQWRDLLHDFFSKTPAVLHYQKLNIAD